MNINYSEDGKRFRFLSCISHKKLYKVIYSYININTIIIHIQLSNNATLQ